ncbi:MAG: PAS domain-containing protein, partial [Bacteroidota bacterium]
MIKLTELSRDELLREAQRLQGENEALQAMEELRRQVEWAREEAQREAKLGTWEYDPQNWETWWSIGMWELFQLARETQPPSWEAYLELFHPEDKPSVESALATSLRSGQPYEFEVRLQPQPEAAQRWVNCRGGILSTENGSVRKLIGAITDVSRSKHKELEQQARNRVLDALLVGKPVREVMQMILEILEVMYPNHLSVVLEWDKASDELTQIAQHGFIENGPTGAKRTGKRTDRLRIAISVDQVFRSHCGDLVNSVTIFQSGKRLLPSRCDFDCPRIENPPI